jgi:hypothetical protein
MRYELAERSVGTAYGGITLVHQLARELGWPRAIDERLQLFKIHLPYHESNHVLNLAYNALAGAVARRVPPVAGSTDGRPRSRPT